MADVIVALDVSSVEEALSMVERLGETGTFYKVGMELYSREGPSVVQRLRDSGKKVFLDLKLHDIPNTAAAAVRSAAATGAQLLTVHALAGRSMMEAASEAAIASVPLAGERLRLIAVTVLTSLSASELEGTLGHSISSLRDEVLRLGSLAASSGMDGVVASVFEARDLRRKLGTDLLVVTPGIRLPGGQSHDQVRVATPAAAVQAGADFLVVGRAVTAAPDPRRALERILEDVNPSAKVGGVAGG